ncbi:MAG: tynA, partial [Frondihabitans sp.]|nr:tynA [Frondihabitans sp.]
MATHPLEPLSAAEIAQVAAVLRRDRGLKDTARFVFVELHEPPKSEVIGWRPGQPWERRGSASIRETSERATYEAVVSLTEDAVVSLELIPDVQPPISVEEFDLAENLVRNDERWQAALLLRGVTDFSLPMIDKWSSGYTGEGDAPSRRLARLLTFVRSAPGDNGYAHPVEGLIVLIDMDVWEVLEVVDHGVVPLPPRDGNFGPTQFSRDNNYPRIEAQREAMKPIEISQPEGSSV